MFEQNKEEMSANVWIDSFDAKLADQHACSLTAGNNRLTWEQASSLVAKMRKMEASVYPSNQKRFRAIYRQIASAFGPEGMNEFLR